MDVVNDLHVVRLRSPFEQQTGERVSLRMGRTVLLAFTNHSYERRVTAVARHEVSIGIRAIIQQLARNGDRVVCGRWRKQPRKAEIQQRLPLLRSVVFENVLAFAGSRTVRPAAGISLRCSRGS